MNFFRNSCVTSRQISKIRLYGKGEILEDLDLSASLKILENAKVVMVIGHKTKKMVQKDSLMK